MAKRVRKSKKLLNDTSKFFIDDFSSEEVIPSKKSYFLIIEIIFLLILVACLGLSYFCYLRIDYYKEKEKKLSSKYENIENRLKEEKENNSSLTKQLNYYKNLDTSIDSIKKEYFEHLLSLENSILDGTTDKKIAYLTFDDGPYYNTYRVFDILDQYEVKATFFTTNTNGEYCYDNGDANCWIRYQE